MNFANLKKEIIDQNLCTRCGSCIGVCPQDALYLSDMLGECIPAINGNVDEICVDCPAPCITGCPGKEVDFPALNDFVYGSQPENYLIGHTINHYIGYASNPDIRKRGSSGGIISAVLDYLLREGRIDGVLTLIDNPDKPLQPEPVIIRDPEKLIKAAQSKYSLAPVNTILRKTLEEEGNYAYVGLPCQIHSLRKLQMQNDPNVKNISLLIGSYCGNIHHFTSVIDFLKRFGVEDLNLVKRIQYRAGEWPGKLLVTLKDGREFGLPKFYANYMNMLYIVKRCQVCTDLSNEFADFSGADAWAPKYEERGKGYSLISTRTAIGDKIIKECLENNILISEQQVEKKEVLTMHSHTIDNKKIGAKVRMELWKLFSKDIPIYNLRMVGLPKLRLILSIVVAAAFALGSTKSMKKIISILPMNMTGKAFAFFRKKWKVISRPKGTSSEYSFEPEGYTSTDEFL